MHTLTAKELEDKEVTAILVRAPAIGSALLNIKFVPMDSLPTYAATDGEHIFFNPQLMGEETPAARRYILAHEILHNLLLHNWRFASEENQELANWACDHVINHIINKEIESLRSSGVSSLFEAPKKLPPVADARFADLCEEEVITVLRKEWQQKPPGQPGPGKGKGNGNKKGQGQGQGNAPQGNGNQPPPQGIGDFLPGNVNDPHQQMLRETWVRHIQTMKQMGTLPAAMARLVEESVQAKVPWQEILRHKVTVKAKDDLRWTKPNPHYLRQRIYLPSLHSERTGLIMLVRDTSGSIGESELVYATSESQAVMECCSPEKFILVDCDAAIGKWEEYEPGDSLKPEAVGGGGTDFRPPFQRVEELGLQPELLIYVTDGHGAWPEKPPPYDVIWLVTTDVVPPWGDHIKVDLTQ